ncbi:MAG TPA: ABC transporter ATP-binding protein [Salinimicrobium sp.]|nr:ABC transporter ATP-binding protein [Salinimicrobium sp.]
MNFLQIENLTKIYPNGVKALDNLSLNISNGLFGLLGPNGAGKSSLMRSIASLQTPSSGKILFNGNDIVENPQEVRKHFGYLPQNFGVYPKISVQELLNHLAILKGVNKQTDRRNQVEALLVQTNLYAHRKKAVATFSGGMKQRFGIAQALLGNPQLIIVDEPTAGLDPEERNRFLNLLSEIGEEVIVILSTHIVEDVRDLCPEMAILANGKIIAQGNPVKLTESLEGKIWSKSINKELLEVYKNRFNVISTRFFAGKFQIQVFSNEKPEDGFNQIPPDLENYFFSKLSSQQF